MGTKNRYCFTQSDHTTGLFDFQNFISWFSNYALASITNEFNYFYQDPPPSIFKSKFEVEDKKNTETNDTTNNTTLDLSMDWGDYKYTLDSTYPYSKIFSSIWTREVGRYHLKNTCQTKKSPNQQ